MMEDGWWWMVAGLNQLLQDTLSISGICRTLTKSLSGSADTGKVYHVEFSPDDDWLVTVDLGQSVDWEVK